MKIGILTFHSAINYGAVLQTYALKKHLSSEGHHVEIINYTPKTISQNYKVFSFAVSFSFIRYALYFLVLAKRFLLLVPKMLLIKKFTEFHSTALNLRTFPFSTRKKIPKDFDAYIIGSDQVWNTNIVGDSLAVYLGNFTSNSDALRIAYAASAGDEENSLKEKELFSLFNAVSVREESLQSHLYQLGVVATLVVDPVLLVLPEIWHAMAEKSLYSIKGKYILLYMVYKVPQAVKIAKRIARQLGIELKIVNDFSFPCIAKDHFLSPIGPEDFVKLFRDAECIITTSFHGTVFSLLFNKNFYFISSNLKGENRIYSLLKALDLSKRMVANVEEIEPIDYSFANDRIAILRAHSMKFLQNALIKDNYCL